ncbi:MAG: triphosphoribosyl-dephospho-CoA synthase [Clostridia bacterium]
MQDNFSCSVVDAVFWALQEELDTTPKPGLVDRANSGAHADMNYDTFVSSIKAISKEFAKYVVISNSADLVEVAKRAKTCGIEIEQTMLDATLGINTHKGAIFCLGLLVCSVSYNRANGISNTLSNVCDTIKKLVDQLSKLATKANSHGQVVKDKYKVSGAFEQAKEGYFDYLTNSLAILGEVNNVGKIKVLLYAMSQLTDTNICYRVGDVVASQVRVIASQALKDFDLAKVTKLDQEFIKANISGGGSADMLSLTLLCYKLKEYKFITL